VRILLLSAYDAQSHKIWRQGLEAHFPQCQWTQLALPPRHFSWRIRGNSLTWAFEARDLLCAPYELLIATSMVDLSALRGLVPQLAALPTVVYFHENQFAYPLSGRQGEGVEPQVLNLYTALCADRVLFNSHFNRNTFLAGVEELLLRLPDHVPANIAEVIAQRSEVIPVPLVDSCYRPSTAGTKTFTLLWNHRWEYDKAPERLLTALERFFATRDRTDGPVRVQLVGQQFRRRPAVFDRLHELLEGEQAVGQWGYVQDREAYRSLLATSHVVLSTALHDFQGLSVLEAVAAGCRPLVPERQAYPEWFGSMYRYDSHLAQPEVEANALADRLLEWEFEFRRGQWLAAPDVEALSWRQLKRPYQCLFECLVASRPSSPG
jgi:glycosyltransferase involved in cell wall biosynthesis